MKQKIKWIILFTIITVFETGLSITYPQALAQETEGIAVIELFTSQGCSSCPPADKLLTAITQAADESNQKIYTLSFHVDYWNKLGWTDPYSKPEFTKRQRVYAKTFNELSVYTPQMIVNGTSGFSGYRQDMAQDAVTRALRRAPESYLTLSTERIGERLHVSYQVSGKKMNTNLVLAMIQDQATNNVPAGENNGKTLSHVHIVKNLDQIALNGPRGRRSLKIPKDMKSGGQIIGFIQEQESMAILGAKAVSF